MANQIHYGYWVFGKNMLDVNLDNLKNNGVTDIFLNYYAFTAHGESKTLNWIKTAANKNIGIHIWVQCFYDGEWHNPKTTNLTSKKNEIRRYANMNGVKGIHLDYLRYPGNAYKTSGGADAITQFVREVRNENPKTMLTCAVMPENEDKYYYGQDISALGKIVDAVVPMAYKGNYNKNTGWLKTITQTLIKQGATIWTGLQAYKSDNNTALLSSTELKNDIQSSLDGGAKGVMLFRYGLSENIKFPTTTTSENMDNRIKTKITVKRITSNDADYLLATITDANGQPIPKIGVGFADNGVKYINTGDDGKARYSITHIDDKAYTIKVAFFGNDKYQPTEKLSMTIDKIETKLSVKRITDKNKDYLLAFLGDKNDNPLANKSIGFSDNGVKYIKTGDDGKARYSITHLNNGKHNIKVAFFGDAKYKPTDKISYGFWIGKIPTSIAVTKDGDYIVATITDADKKPIKNISIGFADNGVKYVNSDANGKAKYKVGDKKDGSYTIKVAFFGNDTYEATEKYSFKFTIKKEAPKPVTLNPYLTTEGCSGMGQCTGYYCACNSLQQCFYRLTGIHVSESTIASVAGTTTAGTGHSGIETAVAWFNRKYGKNIKIKWKNFSEVGWSKLQEYINNGAVFCHILYKDQWGHYEVPKSISGDNVIILNSLGSSCGGSTYCGYIETRSKSTHQRYINGISQKSIAILTL